MAGTAPFSRFEFLIAWRYLRARRAEGGVSVMTWISLIGIALGVMALIVTLAVRSGFRAEFVDTILGANAHVTVYRSAVPDAEGVTRRGMTDYADLAASLADPSRRHPRSPACPGSGDGHGGGPVQRRRRLRHRRSPTSNPSPASGPGPRLSAISTPSTAASPSGPVWRRRWAWVWARGSS